MANQITRELLRTLRDDINAAVAAVAKKHGIEMSAGNASFQADRFTFKLEGRVPGAASIEAKTFTFQAAMYDLDPTWLNKRVTFGRKEFILRGMKPRSRTGSLMLEAVADGKMYRANADDFKRAAVLA